MKILLATSAIIPKGGGIASYNQELIGAFSKHNISLLTDEDINQYEGMIKVYSTFGCNCYSYTYCEKMIDLINMDNYDIIINSSSLLITIISPYLKSPICAISHFVNGKLAILAGHNAQYVNRIIALSKYGKQFIDEKYFISDIDKVQVVYNFVHSNNNKFDKKKISNKPLSIIFPGGTSINKNFLIVMDTLRMLVKSDLEFNFYWIGSGTLPSAKLCFASDVSKLVREDSRIHFMGRISREQAISMMDSVNIFVLPSRGEGCPMTLLEAMSSGCIPIVSDAKHGSREILENANTGVIVRNNNSKDLFKSITDILMYPEKYESNYFKTFEYSKDVLSEMNWMNLMQSIIYDCINDRKNEIALTKKSFIINILRIKRDLYKERIKRIFLSLKSSFICNWFFLTK